MPLTIDKVKREYGRIKRRAWSAFRRQDYNGALSELSTSAEVAYAFNWIYSDPDSEELLQQISHALFGTRKVSPKKGRVVFYDAFGWDNRGLTQQYIRALDKLGVEFLFVFEKRNAACSKAISADLAQCGHRAEVFELDRRSTQVEQAKTLLGKLTEYAPSHALLHLEPGSAMALCAFAALPDIPKYNLNLTDHAFWLGSRCIDYNIEYRNYGQTVSLEKRGLSEKQLLQLPYYPIQNAIPFKGWPNIPEESVVKIFSGSSFYKIYGEKGLFFDLVKRLLQENPSSVLYFAGWGDAAPLKRFIAKNHFEKRFFLLGHRSDIDAVFEQCDVYLGTYPTSGGLMSQYAAIHGKPILAFTTTDLPANALEEVICHNRYENITFYSQEEFFAYAKRLCTDATFRVREGKRLEGCVITPDQFTSGLNGILTQNRSYKPFVHVDIDYRKWTQLYLDMENNFLRKYRRRFLRYRIKALITALIVLLESASQILNRSAKRQHEL